MMELQLPWVVGPVPMIFTVVSAAIYLHAVVIGTRNDGLQFISAYLLSLGVVSVVGSKLLNSLDIRYTLVICQFTILLTVFILVSVANYRNKLQIQRKFGNKKDTVKNIFAFTAVYIVNNIICFLPFARRPCTTAKCFAVEDAFGAKYANFGTIYLGCVVGCLFLFFTIIAIIHLLRDDLNKA